MVSLFARTRIRFGRTLSKDCASTVIATIWAQILYLAPGVTLSLRFDLLSGIFFPPLSVVFVGFFPRLFQAYIWSRNRKSTRQDFLNSKCSSIQFHKMQPSFQQSIYSDFRFITRKDFYKYLWKLFHSHMFLFPPLVTYLFCMTVDQVH